MKPTASQIAEYDRRKLQTFAQGRLVRILPPLYSASDEWTNMTGRVSEQDGTDVLVADQVWVTAARLQPINNASKE